MCLATRLEGIWKALDAHLPAVQVKPLEQTVTFPGVTAFLTLLSSTEFSSCEVISDAPSIACWTEAGTLGYPNWNSRAGSPCGCHVPQVIICAVRKLTVACQTWHVS